MEALWPRPVSGLSRLVGGLSEAATILGDDHPFPVARSYAVSGVLLLIDVQKNMLLPPEPVPDAATVGPAIAAVLAEARAAGTVIVHIRNTGSEDDPDFPGAPGWELVHDVREGEHVVDKPLQDAFAETDLADLIPADAALTIVGMQSEYCVRETSLAALQRGHAVTLVRGAHATYPGKIDAHSGVLAAADVSARIETELAAAGASIVDVADVNF